MANFNWICRECSIYWDREYDLGKAPERTKCPQCKKLSNRYYLKENIGVSFKDDKDFHTVRRRYQKHAEKGYDKDSANRFLRQQIEKSRSWQDDETYRYKSANFNYEKMAGDGVVKKLSDKETSEKIDRAKKLTIDAYDKANKMGYKDIGKDKLDITKPQKQG
jgi:phage FluMu protein Com